MGQLQAMRTLSLPNACLTELPSIEHIPYQSINLKGNRLRSLDSIPDTVKELDVSYNSLSSDGILSEPLVRLETLKATHNYLCIPLLDQFVLLYPSLKVLNLAFNSLRVVGFLRDSNLEELYVTHNQLHLLSELPLSLKKLVADTNSITMVQSKLPPILESLDLAYNSLRYAGLPLSWPTTLKELHLNHNKIERFPRKLPDSLEVLTLNENNITELPTTLPKELRIFTVSSNRIRHLPTYTWHKKFQLFLINDNCLTEIPDTFKSTIFSTEGNWNTVEHSIAQSIIKRCWKRYVITLRLRHLIRTQKYKEELFMVSMMPERWNQIDDLDPLWFRKHRDHNRTDHPKD
jgi:Leucine-rich repeat (LRR) protein